MLFLFEKQGVRDVVLGSFGTGVFRNRVEVVVGLWKRLLGGRFRGSFDKVVFCVLGNDSFLVFEQVFKVISAR